jgi:hypothetical protein
VLTAEDSEEGSRLVTDVFADTPCRRLFCIVSLVSNFVAAERVGSVCDVFIVPDSEEASRLGSRLRSEVCVTVDTCTSCMRLFCIVTIKFSLVRTDFITEGSVGSICDVFSATGSEDGRLNNDT